VRGCLFCACMALSASARFHNAAAAMLGRRVGQSSRPLRQWHNASLFSDAAHSGRSGRLHGWRCLGALRANSIASTSTPGASSVLRSSAGPSVVEAESAAGVRASVSAAPVASHSVEERVKQLEATVVGLESKLAEVEKLAKRRGFMQMVMQHGLPFALWYATCWTCTWLAIYAMLEFEVVSWQESLRPLLSSAGMDAQADRIDPTVGNLVLAFLVNECLEPLRLPIVLATGIPMMKVLRKARGLEAAAAAAPGAAAAATAAGAAGSFGAGVAK